MCAGTLVYYPYNIRTMLFARNDMPPATTTNERIDLRTSPEIKELIVRAASTAGLSVSAFLLGAAQDRAKQVLNEAELISLMATDWTLFFSALENADKPRPRLAKAMTRHQTWIDKTEK